jgi:hypothetical protein
MRSGALNALQCTRLGEQAASFVVGRAEPEVEAIGSRDPDAD